MRRLAGLAAATALLAAGAAAAEPIREVVSFGDSLSDAGTYGFRSTTMPSPTWNQMVAAHFGLRQEPNEHAGFPAPGRGAAAALTTRPRFPPEGGHPAPRRAGRPRALTQSPHLAGGTSP